MPEKKLNGPGDIIEHSGLRYMVIEVLAWKTEQGMRVVVEHTVEMDQATRAWGVRHPVKVQTFMSVEPEVT